LGRTAALRAASLANALWLLAAPVSALAQDTKQPFDITADEVEYQADRDVYIARGNVRIVQQGRTLTADRVIFNQKTNEGVAIGNVVVTQGEVGAVVPKPGRAGHAAPVAMGVAGDKLESDFLQFNVDSLLGVVFHGRLDSPKSNYKMSGDEIQKTGDQTYTFVNGHFTTCRCPNPDSREPWALTAKQADLQVDGYARARNASFEVLGIPIIWWPYVFYPLKRERETGFLFPDFGSTKQSGYYVSLPFFWAARDNVNVMLRPEWEEKRGFKPSVDTEYVFGQRGAGELYGTFINDQDISSSNPKTPFSPDRWAASWKHLQDLPFGAWLGVDAKALSDNLYTLDFRDFVRYFPDEFLQSFAFAGDQFGDAKRFALTGGVALADDLQNQTDRNRTPMLEQRLPDVQFDAMPQPIDALPGVVASSGVEYTHFAHLGSPSQRHLPRRELVDDQWYDTGADGIPDGRERDSNGVTVTFDANRDNGITEINGRFNEGELLADQGHRLLLQPRVAYPIRIADLFEVYPEVGYYGTFYDTDLQGAASRSLFTGRLDLSTEFRGPIDLPFGLGTASHRIVPFVTWVGVSNAGQNGNPLFVPPTAVPQDRLREIDVDNVTLDTGDRIQEANNVVFGVRNRLFKLDDSSLLGEVLVSAEYRAAQHDWGPAVLQGTTQLPAGLSLRFQSVYQVNKNEFTDGLAELGWQHPFGHAFSIGYRYLTDIPKLFEDFAFKDDRYQRFDPSFSRVNQISGNVRLQLTRQWAVTYLGSYSFENSFSLSHRFGLEYLSRCRCWAARLEIDDTVVRGFQWHLQYRLLGLGDDAAHPFSGRGSHVTNSSGKSYSLF